MEVKDKHVDVRHPPGAWIRVYVYSLGWRPLLVISHANRVSCCAKRTKEAVVHNRHQPPTKNNLQAFFPPVGTNWQVPLWWCDGVQYWTLFVSVLNILCFVVWSHYITLLYSHLTGNALIQSDFKHKKTYTSAFTWVTKMVMQVINSTRRRQIVNTPSLLTKISTLYYCLCVAALQWGIVVVHQSGTLKVQASNLACLHFYQFALTHLFSSTAFCSQSTLVQHKCWLNVVALTALPYW